VSAESGLIHFIEQVAADPCTNPRVPMMRGISQLEQKVVYFRPTCKSWSCPTCARRNRAKWVATAINGVAVLSDRSAKIDFVTVTSHERLGPAETLRVLPHGWDMLRKRLRRAAATVEYMLIPEAHKDGRVHLHGLVSARLPKRWWKDNAREVGMGYQSDVKEVVSVGGVAGYVSKYIGKQMEFTFFGNGFHRVRCSQGFPRLPDHELPAGWTFSVLPRDVSLAQDMVFWQGRGYQVALGDGLSAWGFVDPENRKHPR